MRNRILPPGPLVLFALLVASRLAAAERVAQVSGADGHAAAVARVVHQQLRVHLETKEIKEKKGNLLHSS